MSQSSSCMSQLRQCQRHPPQRADDNQTEFYVAYDRNKGSDGDKQHLFYRKGYDQYTQSIGIFH